MFNHKNNTDYWEFYVQNDGNEIPFEEWKDTNNIIYYFPLSTLVDNGNASVVEGRCIVPINSIYLFDNVERTTLMIPNELDKTIRLRSEGMLNSPDFKYHVDLLSSETDGKLLGYEMNGNTVTVNDCVYLLNEKQYSLIKKISEYEQSPVETRNTEYNLRCFGEIKELAQSAGCELDSYLQNENVYVPEKMKVDIVKDGDDYHLAPAIEDASNAQFQHSFERSRWAVGIYPTSNSEGERTRVVLTPEQTEGMKEIKLHRNCSKEELMEIVENPTEYFDSDVFDLSELYSDRVIEYGLYRPRFSPFVSPYKSCWIPGAEVTTPNEGTKKILVENAYDLLCLHEAITIATERNNPVVHYKGSAINIDDAKFLEGVAEKQLSHPTKPVTENETRIVSGSSARKVLIIKENEDELTYVEKNDTKAERYVFHPDSFFDSQFSLKDHQKEGIAWLQHIWERGASGCLLADDMGLGKTLQVLYFIDWHFHYVDGNHTYLIVAPISLLENWQQEYNRFFKAPRLKMMCLTGRDIPRKYNKDVVKELQEMDIVLTNYETVRNGQLNLCAVDFDVVVLDEAQKIKTPGTMVTSACKALKSKMKVAMTGTPVENSLLDLWCIMDFCTPGLLGCAKDFSSRFVRQLDKPDVDITALGNEIRDIIGEHLIRRQKQDVAKDLPMKYEHKEPMSMPKVQEDSYLHIVKEYMDNRKAAEYISKDLRQNMLVTLFRLRKISEHPYLEEGSFEDKTLREVIATSARLILTEVNLDNIRDRGEKAIIFADQKNTQQMLQQMVYKKYGITAMIINGDTPTNSDINKGRLSRQSSIDKFQASPGFNVIIMSPISAGVGLNVTAANHVIHYTRHWNPAKESQATDRAYRIGQTKDVHVYYPLAILKDIDSFDIVLDNLLERKSSLASSTIFPTERMEITQDEILNGMFGMA